MTSLVPYTTIEERPEKIHPRHLEQTAIVYIRQSSLQQVHRNQESTKLQYSLVEVARELGWVRDRVVVIDDDLGVSGSSAIGRVGFQRVLSEVALDHVGLIVGVEMSRLARSNKDWHQLLELCARFGTLIADLDGLYDPSRYNDRLLLGLKGTMSEAELHILRQRLMQGKLQKARRGELAMPVPTGYLQLPSREVVLDPDEEVQASVRAVFDSFVRVGTTHGVLGELVAKGVQIGVRRRTGADRGQLEWHHPHRGMVANMLRNPIYAGAYVFGRRRIDPRKYQPGRPASGRTALLPPEQWHALVHDRLPAYITWDQYMRNQARLAQNRDRRSKTGAYRNGPSLLTGLVTCGKCGYRMNVQYGKSLNGKRYARYVCNHASGARAEAICCGLTGPRLDEVVSTLALNALKPAALEMSMRISEEIERDRQKTDALWNKRLQRARYDVERAQRQYQAVEPENRLVARTLEKSWEAALKAERDLQEEDRRRQAQQPHHLSALERATIRRLATDLPTLWSASTTTIADRKAVLRLLIDHVTVVVHDGSEWVDLTVQWAGGNETRTKMRRPVGRLEEMSEHKALLKEIWQLRRNGYTTRQIADRLNAGGWTTPTQRNGFTDRLVQMMLHRHGTVAKGAKRPPNDDPDDWWLSDLADEIEVPLVTLYGWMTRGWVKGRRVDGHWAIRADRDERKRLCQLRSRHPAPKRTARRRTHKPT
jgi:DNA invertase Pin-like site-specific DNA recombinase